MCGALGFTPTMALNADLHIVLIDIAGRCMTTKLAIGLRKAGFLYKHAEIPARFGFISNLMDHRVAKLNYGRVFSPHIPARMLSEP